MDAEFSQDPDASVIEQIARQALGQFPQEFRAHLTDIVLQVEEFADVETLSKMGIEDRWELLGLYHGHPLSSQSIWASGDLPPTISLYRQPLLLSWKQSGASLKAVVKNLVVHEVGHHFGLSDEDMHAIESEAD